MKSLYTLSFALFFISYASAQITVTSENVAAIFAPGGSQNFYLSGTNQMVDIGQLGGGNTYDFSSFSFMQTAVSLNVAPEDTPYGEDYPDADICVFVDQLSDVIDVQQYQYFSNQQGFDVNSFVSEFVFGMNATQVVTEEFDPVLRTIEYPTTFESQWSSVSIRSNFQDSQELPSDEIIDDYFVDAYGTLLLPDGISEEVLRIRRTRIVNESAPEISFSFWSNSGVRFFVNPIDPINAPVEGMVMITDMNYTDPLIPLSTPNLFVEENGGIQVYPNPAPDYFNLQLTLTTGSDLSFQVHDLSGKVMLEEYWSSVRSGSSQHRIDTSELPTGVFIGTLRGEEESQSVKLVVTR